MIPIAKKRGRTVLGVRIGLSVRVSLAVIAGFCVDDLLPCLQSLLSKSSIYKCSEDWLEAASSHWGSMRTTW